MNLNLCVQCCNCKNIIHLRYSTEDQGQKFVSCDSIDNELKTVIQQVKELNILKHHVRTMNNNLEDTYQYALANGIKIKTIQLEMKKLKDEVKLLKDSLINSGKPKKHNVKSLLNHLHTKELGIINGHQTIDEIFALNYEIKLNLQESSTPNFYKASFIKSITDKRKNSNTKCEMRTRKAFLENLPDFKTNMIPNTLDYYI